MLTTPLGLPVPAAITTIVCDYDGVLTDPLSQRYAALTSRAGIDIGDFMQALSSAKRATGIDPMAALQLDTITEAGFVDRIEEHLPAGSPPLTAEALRAAWFDGRPANDAFVTFLRTLRACGYRLALLTNTVAEWWPQWRARVPVGELFDVIVASSEEGVRKPDPEIYFRLLSRMQVPATECLYIDTVADHCEVASSFGMRAVHFRTTSQATSSVAAALLAAVEPEPEFILV
ncbi:MAG TPA: HAD family phosphatase [Jatrophihabitantaceae bacterium]|jgi:putative hydrolase of the HAD superfamily